MFGLFSRKPNEKIAAIKRYREQTGASLKEAMAAVERMDYQAQPQVTGIGSGEERLRQLVLAQKKLEAIKYYREMTGASLRAAKLAVDSLEAMQKQEGSQILNANEIESLLLSGKKIAAIKSYRVMTGSSLRDAKAYIDALEERLRRR